MKKGYLQDILRSNKTVFSFKDMLLLWSDADDLTVASRLNYYVKRGDLHHIRRGLYAKDNNYDKLELATKILTPSYISFETVLARAGVTFQWYGQIFVATYQTKEIVCDGQKYSFKTLKDSILLNGTGIEKKENHFIASPERAFLDTAYLYKNYHFDNLSSLNWEKVFEFLSVYGGNRRMEKNIKEYFEDYKSNK